VIKQVSLLSKEIYVLYWRSVCGKIFWFESVLYLILMECASKTLVLSCRHFPHFFNSSSSWISRNSICRGGVHSTGGRGMGHLFFIALTSSGFYTKANDSLNALRSLEIVSLFSTSPLVYPTLHRCWCLW